MAHASAMFMFAFLFVIILVSPPVSSLSSLPRGSHLSAEKVSDVLISPDNTFTCGFYQVGTNAYHFSIWFTNSANRTVVWAANRGRPVAGRGSRVELRSDGTMALVDVDDSVLWATNTSSAQVDEAQLLDSGNLVLKNSSGKILWQSFDFPTDTLLPGQPITKGIKLVSASDRTSTSPGNFVLLYDNDNVLRLMYDGPDISSIYWPNLDLGIYQNGRTNYNSSRYGVLDDVGTFRSSDRLTFNASDAGLGVRRRLTVDHDGNMRLYSLNVASGTWLITWQAIFTQCRVHGLCGRNGICTYDGEPKCSCPPGYKMADPANWNKGCVPKFGKIACDDRRGWKFVEVLRADFFGYDNNYSNSVSLDACRKICEEDCSCKAFVYRKSGDGSCFSKAELFNGYTAPDFPGTLYLKLPRDFEANSDLSVHGLVCNTSAETGADSFDFSRTVSAKRNDEKWNYGYGFLLVFGFIEVLFISTGWWFLFRKGGPPTMEERGYQMMSDQFKRFSFKALKRATGGFKEELGKGGSGTVHKGVLDDKRVVAVKTLTHMGQGVEEFQTELSVIGRIYHMNLVRMWGFCLERSRMLLVYEFVENGSLDKILFGAKSPLDWHTRFRIALGTAKGLAYLHHECLDWIIHCDIKPENILLDANYEPKIADFGLVKLTQRGISGLNVTRIRGTKGYMAPEWTSNAPITAMVDVYSYGVILLELVKGSRVSSWVSKDGEEMGYRLLVRKLNEALITNQETLLAEFIDQNLSSNYNKKQAEVLLEVAMSCLEEDRNKRPTMGSVVHTLLSCIDVDLL